jgi:hypothetical protein
MDAAREKAKNPIDDVIVSAARKPVVRPHKRQPHQ